MPVYDSAQYLRKSIDSVLTQTFRNFEFIIVSDSRTANEDVSITESYSDPRIVHVLNKRRPGFVASLNLGIRAARGEYIARMDSDDISMPERFERQVQYLTHNPGTGVLGTGCETIDDRDQVKSQEIMPSDPEVMHWFLMFGSPITHSSVLIRRKLIEKLRGYRELPHGEDYDLWLRASRITDIANLPDILLRRRIHPNSLTDRYYRLPHDQQAAKIHANAISLLSGLSVRPDVALAMSEYKIRRSREAAEAARVLRQLYLRFISQKHMSEQSTAVVTSDLTMRLHKLSLACARQNPLISVKIILLLSRLSPAGFVSSIFRTQERAVRRTWRALFGF
jgi:glycosyltransferase involved in cell wall biosynthesis